MLRTAVLRTAVPRTDVPSTGPLSCLRSHLASDVETFSSIGDAVRVELETRYLTATDRRLAEVTDLLGFSGLSALSRWFSGRFGCSASAWRAAHRGRMVPAR